MQSGEMLAVERRQAAYEKGTHLAEGVERGQACGLRHVAMQLGGGAQAREPEEQLRAVGARLRCPCQSRLLQPLLKAYTKNVSLRRQRL